MNKNEKLQDAIGMIGDDLIVDAKKGHRKKRRYSAVLQGLAAVAVIAIIISAAVYFDFGGGNPSVSPDGGTADTLHNDEAGDKYVADGGNNDTNKDSADGNNDSNKDNNNDNKDSDDNNNNKDNNNTDNGTRATLVTAENNEVLSAYAVAKTEYPVMSPYPDEGKAAANGDYDTLSDEHDAWNKDYRAQLEKYENMDIDINDFVKACTNEFLGGADGSNLVYSPLNVYMALGMLAELTDSGSRQQILDVLGNDSIEELREEANALWNANYQNDGASATILSSSLWLNKNIKFKQDTLDLLASDYYASSYQGEMGSAAFNGALQEWLNIKTGGMLTDQIRDIQMDSETVLALATTIYYSGNWSTKFMESKTTTDTFHGAKGDSECDFMNASQETMYYWGDKFSAIAKGLEGHMGQMYFILPDEGVEISELTADTQWLELVQDSYGWSNQTRIKVNMSIPKFDVSSEFDLSAGLKNLGITDVFDAGVSDFSPITDADAISLSKAQHGVRVTIDEEGCTAAAYIAMQTSGAALPPEDEVDFVLDRPFMFVITSSVGTPLFIGVVNNVN